MHSPPPGKKDSSQRRVTTGGRPSTHRPGRGQAGRQGTPRPPRKEPVDPPESVGPSIPSDITPDMLDRQARRELSGLGKEDAEEVAKHLVMASLVVEDDPSLAHEHARAAAARGPRVPVVRETVGITAYLLGDYALCLRELRTHRRLSGSNAQLPMMIDAERGLGRPERGIELARGVDRSVQDDRWAVELAIALSGCRLDLGQTKQALDELQIPQLNPDVAFAYSPDLFDAYAVVLEDLGKNEEAATWSKRAEVAREVLQEAKSGDDDGVGEVIDTLDPDLETEPEEQA